MSTAAMLGMAARAAAAHSARSPRLEESVKAAQFVVASVDPAALEELLRISIERPSATGSTLTATVSLDGVSASASAIVGGGLLRGEEVTA